ncbi:MAG: NADH-quinone oxidoreductase subunit J [Lachnospiraceae bacterium]|nr:NADH-quinone oxidoreductase subunit J [Lachnospiraceae bacterium]
MTLADLSTFMRENGIVGAGGAGFPSYAKLNKKADTIILNCAECEPLLRLHRQLLAKKTFEIMTALREVAQAVEAEQVIIAVKGSYTSTIEAVKAHLDSFPMIKLGILQDVYPAGDEVIAIYGTTGRVVPPGKLPIEVGVIVYNVETMYNLYVAMTEKKPVTHKYVTVGGAVENPATYLVPLGMSFKEVVKLAGKPTVEDCAYICGGPMTGKLATDNDVVTKTTNAILVLPKNHYVIMKRMTPVSMSMKRAMSSCCQCQMCTDLCPRHLIGYPIQPHLFMRSATSGVTKDLEPYFNTAFCSQCGVCEMFACVQGLNPRTLIGEFKKGMGKNGVKLAKDVEAGGVHPDRDFRRISMSRLRAKLGLEQYNHKAPISEDVIAPRRVKIMMSQHIGVPATPFVKTGDKVEVGQVIGKIEEGKLGVNVHSSVAGKVLDVKDKFVLIEAEA